MKRPEIIIKLRFTEVPDSSSLARHLALLKKRVVLAYDQCVKMGWADHEGGVLRHRAKAVGKFTISIDSRNP